MRYRKKQKTSLPLFILLILLTFIGISRPVFAAEEDDQAQEELSEQEKKEAEEKRKAEEEKIKELFPFSFNDISKNLVIIESKTCIGEMAGSGFIANMDGKTYLFTNQHVIMGADSIEFKTVTGEKLQPKGVELSHERDIARLPLEDREDALEFSAKYAKGIPIAVFGNSEGAGVATELYGILENPGAERFEVSADFVSGNSGSPTLNTNKQVIGIASYVQYSDTSKMKEGTKFENSVRRFCYRMDNVQFSPVNWRRYNEKYGKPYLVAQSSIESVFEIINNWYDDPFSRAPTRNLPDSSLHSWARKHNVMVDRVNKIRKSGGSRTQLAHVRDEVQQSAHDLAVVMHRLATDMQKIADDPGLTGFLREEFGGYAGGLEFASEVLDYVGEEIADWIDSQI